MADRLDTLKGVFDDFQHEESILTWRFPWFNMLYNYVIALVMFLLIVSLTIWGLNVRTERKAEALTAEALAAWQSEQEAAAQAEAEELAAIRSTQEYILDQESKVLAKLIYGIRNFVDKYGYSDADIETYMRCVTNRYEAGNGINNLEAVVSREGQFLGYSDSNPVLDDYYRIAHSFLERWHSESTKPCDLSYQFAELTPSGIWLKADINADGYARRWRAE